MYTLKRGVNATPAIRFILAFRCFISRRKGSRYIGTLFSMRQDCLTCVAIDNYVFNLLQTFPNACLSIINEKAF